MKVLLDAQLPRSLGRVFWEAGYDAIHTFDLPKGNKTSDREICQIADTSGRMVITKDSDFVDSHLLFGRPSRLLVVSTGNIFNEELLELFRMNLTKIALAAGSSSWLEITRDQVILH